LATKELPLAMRIRLIRAQALIRSFIRPIRPIRISIVDARIGARLTTTATAARADSGKL
jgi:hypothetical protein